MVNKKCCGPSVTNTYMQEVSTVREITDSVFSPNKLCAVELFLAHFYASDGLHSCGNSAVSLI